MRAFNEFGYDATSMGTLADRLGLSKSAVYHHFPSKEQLLEAALDEALGGLEGVLAEPGAASGTAAGAAAARAAPRGRGARRAPAVRDPAAAAARQHRGRARGAATAGASSTARSRALVVAARDAGELRSDIDPRIAERLLFGMINSIVEWYRPEGPEDASRLADDVLAVAVDGLRMPR